MSTNRKLLSFGALAVLAVLFVAVILVSNALFRGARLDLTQNHLYTLSQGTKNILSSIEEPVSLTLYFSDKAAAESSSPDAAAFRNYAPRVREMLAEMAARASLFRTESRWGLYHHRVDFPHRNDAEWFCHTWLRKDADGTMRSEKRPVEPYVVPLADDERSAYAHLRIREPAALAAAL